MSKPEISVSPDVLRAPHGPCETQKYQGNQNQPTTQPVSGHQLDQELAALADFTYVELAASWQTHFRTDPPKCISRRLLIRAIAYQLQVKRYGGLKLGTKRRLRTMAVGTTDLDRGHNKVPSATLQPGTRLIREWNGVSHVVEMTDGGYIWNSTQYCSLSAIARAITGARWSGPRFFGLTSGERA